MSRHYAIWIDHHEARVFHVTDDTTTESSIHAPPAHLHRHAEGGEGHKAHPSDGERFFHDVARSLDGADEVLVVGPGVAKLQFIKHVHRHDHLLEPKIVGVETVDHPTDPQLVAYAKHYFKKIDRTR